LAFLAMMRFEQKQQKSASWGWRHYQKIFRRRNLGPKPDDGFPPFGYVEALNPAADLNN